ncbi:MAG: S-layer homology domain-containing protein [Oscillospiraceae bacterium]|nr:S-layer homology domain-containing protein [Oscillospiraceae bacterium]
MKKLVFLSIVLSLILAFGTSFSFAAPEPPGGSNALSPFGQYLESKYKDPDRVFSTDALWRLGSASHTDETLPEKIQASYDGRFRGVELSLSARNVSVGIRPNAGSVVTNAQVSYTVSLSDAKGAGIVTLSFTMDGRYLDLTSATALNGFSILEPLSWEQGGDQVWTGAVKLFYPGFVQNDSPLDILRISGVARDLLGKTTVALTDFTVTGNVNGFSGAMPGAITTAEAVTTVVEPGAALPPSKGNDGDSQGNGVTAAPTPTPTPSEAPGGEPSGEPGGEPAPTPTQPTRPSRPQSLMADIAPDYWAVEFIDGLVARGIVDGYPMPDGSREYRPENDITRLEMAKLIVASLELELIYDYDGSDTFADWFDVQEWGRPYMAAAIEAGIVLGSAEGDGLYLFPDDNIIREEMIAMSVRALGAEVPGGGECDAPDFDSVSEWAMNDVAFAVKNEMINLRQGNVAPVSNATRAESAIILYKLLEYLGI